MGDAADSKQPTSTGGIPYGNTVAVVGDPGTGKTSLLLSLFRYGERNSEGSGVVTGRCQQRCRVFKLRFVRDSPPFQRASLG